MLFDHIAGFLTDTVGNNLKNNEEDVRIIKNSLKNLNFFEEEGEPHGIITRELDTGIKNFQRENNLRVDGRLFPGGETEGAIMLGLANAPVPQRKPDLHNVPVPSRKPEQIDGVFASLLDRLKGQKDLLNFIFRGPKGILGLIKNISETTQEIMHDQRNGPA